MTVEEAEDVARLINGLMEAGDLLMNHSSGIPHRRPWRAKCWMESRAAVSGNHEPKRWPDDWAPRDAP